MSLQLSAGATVLRRWAQVSGTYFQAHARDWQVGASVSPHVDLFRAAGVSTWHGRWPSPEQECATQKLWCLLWCGFRNHIPHHILLIRSESLSSAHIQGKGVRLHLLKERVLKNLCAYLTMIQLLFSLPRLMMSSSFFFWLHHAACRDLTPTTDQTRASCSGSAES